MQLFNAIIRKKGEPRLILQISLPTKSFACTASFFSSPEHPELLFRLAPFTYSHLKKLTLHAPLIPTQSSASAIMVSQEQWQIYRIRNSIQLTVISDDRNVPISYDEAAEIKQGATERLSELHQCSINWPLD